MDFEAALATDRQVRLAFVMPSRQHPLGRTLSLSRRLRLLDAAKRAGVAPSPEVAAAAEAMRADYEHQLDARYAAARGYVDAIVYPEDTRTALGMALRAALQNAGPHIGPFHLPPMIGEAL